MEFRVSVGAAAYWVARARGKRVDRVRLTNRKPGRAWNRTPRELEQRILSVRSVLREKSVLGEYGSDAISLTLQYKQALEQVRSRMTIYRVLARHGVLDGVHRQRRPAPPKGWYLLDLACGHAELDSFDFIEDLKIAGGPLVDVLTGTSLHGALAEAWIMERPSARATLQALVEHWRRDGLPTYAQFDNATIFQGAHQFADTVGRISRLCLALGVVPVFAPPREPGFQNMPSKASMRCGKARSGSATTAPMSKPWRPSPHVISQPIAPRPPPGEKALPNGDAFPKASSSISAPRPRAP